MAQQTIVWTVLPNGRATQGKYAGQLRVSIVVSPRLTPESSSEQVLKAFEDWREWPQTLAKFGFALRIAGTVLELKVTSKTDPSLWQHLLPWQTPVTGFEFKDMSTVNLRSFTVRNVIGLVRQHYSQLAVQSASTHPTLLPWAHAHPDLKDMLHELGTRTETIRTTELALPGFERLFDPNSKSSVDEPLRSMVFGSKSRYRARMAGIGADQEGNPIEAGSFPIRALPPDWHAPNGHELDDELMALWRTQAEYTLYQANRFYQRTQPSAAQQALRHPSMANIPQPPIPPEFDFHRIIASFGDYPELLRKLGLVIDCVLPLNSVVEHLLAATGQAQGVMSLVLSGKVRRQLNQDACPGAAWQADQLRFTTRTRSEDHERGMLNLRYANDNGGSKKNQSLFDVYQVDPDAAALKTVNFLLSAQRLVTKSLVPPGSGHGAVTYTTGDKQAVAALRSGGLGVSRHGRAATVAQNAAAAALKNQAIEAGPLAAKKIALFAEDVLRGYRVDVQELAADESGAWRSLCQRRGIYRLVGTNTVIDLPDDEGYVKGASTSSAAGGPADGVDPNDHYLHESLFRWTGWSLVAARPGRTLRAREDASSGVQSETPEMVEDAVTAGGNGLSVDFKALKASLPRLRFGATYRFRARLVDLAGNSIAFDDPSLKEDSNHTDPVTYSRFEPVDPPALLQRARNSEGESLERLVIRSNWNASATDYLQTPAFSAAIALPASADFDYIPVNERHIVPPKSSQLQCETHGLFDALFSNTADIKTAYEVACRDAGTLYDTGPDGQVELITPTSLQHVATTKALPPRLPSEDNPTGDRLAPGQYVIRREALVHTPYLPDGAAGGIALRAIAGHHLPGVDRPVILGPNAAVLRAPNEDLVLLVSYGKNWPDTQGLRLVLAERSGKLHDSLCETTFNDNGLPVWDDQQRVLTLFVPKGKIVRLRYSSFVHQDFLHSFGLPDWTSSQGERAYIRNMAQFGCHWMITPYRPLVLVHATQQPVCNPQLFELTAKRGVGDQHAVVRASVRLHGPSTGKIEVEAEWDEWVDDPNNPAGPKLQTSRGMLGEILLAENSPNVFSLSTAIDKQAAFTSDDTQVRGDRHEFGDTKFRLVRYQLRATTRFREYLPPALYEQRDNVTRLGPVAEGSLMEVGASNDPGAPVLAKSTGTALNSVVLASAPPDEPRLQYILPTFLWNETTSKQRLDSTRYGNGLRVWLDRPWFSSGNGELLGVVILGEGRRFTDIPNNLVPLVTQWGLDPLWDTALPKHQASASDFSASIARENNVPLQESPDQTVTVVGHRVYWDAQRAQWYCDIELEPGSSYMPFIRLALVRYQPNAIRSAKISRVVLADFSQVLPRRRATFQRNGTELTFTLRGNAPEHGPMKFPLDSEFIGVSFVPGIGQTVETGRNKIELVLQTRDPDLDSDLAWSDTAVLASSLAGHEGNTSSASGMVLRNKILARPPLFGTPGLIPPVLNIPDLGQLLDPLLWSVKTTLSSTGGRPARVAVREYERYYTDRSVPETRSGKKHQRRVVEERLVYCAFFDLADS